MKKIIITESQYKRIFRGKINEQKQYGQTLVLSNDPSVKEIRQVFREYLNQKVPYTNETTYYERANEMRQYFTSTSKDSELEDVIGFFKQKGYKMPNDKIKKFQEALMVKNFRTKDDKKADFADGVFGVATAKAAIKYEVSMMDRAIKSRGKNYTYGDNLQAHQQTQREIEQGKITPTAKAKEQPTKLSDRPATGTQKIGVGTQSYD